MQGQCTGHSDMINKDLLVSKAVVTCLHHHIVPVKLLNPTANPVHVNKCTFLAKFQLCDNATDLHFVTPDVQMCAHVSVVSDSKGKSTSDSELPDTGSNHGIRSAGKGTLQSYLASSISDEHSPDQKQTLLDCSGFTGVTKTFWCSCKQSSKVCFWSGESSSLILLAKYD